MKMTLISGGHNIYGQVIGVICLGGTLYPKLPGHIKNATTFDFPVSYKVIAEATPKSFIEEGGRNLVNLFIKAAQELEKEGVKAITGSCGFMSIFQEEIANAVRVPVFMSSLIQVPLVYRMLRKDQKVGIMTACKKYLSNKHLEAVGIKNIPLCIEGMDNQEEFMDLIFKKKKTVMDTVKFKNELVSVATEMVKRNPEIGAMILECTDMSPFAKDIQEATGLPIFDIVTLVNMVYNAVVRKHYVGIL
jgi:aspartate/glutamate racemase